MNSEVASRNIYAPADQSPVFSTGQFHLNTDGEGALLASFKYRNLKLFSYTSVYGFSSHHPPRTPAPAPRRVDQHQARRACAVQCCTTSPRPGLYPAWSPAQLPRRRGRQRRRSGGCRWRARGKSGAPPLCLHEAANPGLRGQEGGGGGPARRPPRCATCHSRCCQAQRCTCGCPARTSPPVGPRKSDAFSWAPDLEVHQNEMHEPPCPAASASPFPPFPHR